MSEEIYYNQEERQLETIIRASLSNCPDEKLIEDIVKYIILQFNSESFKGKINFAEYSMILKRTKQSLYTIIFINHYTDDYYYRFPVYQSSLNLCIELISRLYRGLDYEKALKEIEANGGMIFAQMRSSPNAI